MKAPNYSWNMLCLRRRKCPAKHVRVVFKFLRQMFTDDELHELLELEDRFLRFLEDMKGEK